MKTTLLLLLGSLSMASCEDKAYPAKFNVQVVNEEDKPISNATVGTGTFARWEPGQAFGRDIWEGPEKQKTQVTQAFPKRRKDHK